MLQRLSPFNQLFLARLLVALGCLCLCAGRPAWAEGDTTGSWAPSAAAQVPVRLGSVDAVRGNLNLALPLGPRLPGRLPVGLVWRFDSQDPVHWRAGGSFKAVVWPTVAGIPGIYGTTSPTTMVQVGTTTYTFQRHSAPTGGVAATINLGEALAARFVPGTGGTTNLLQPSSDGTKWYAEIAVQVAVPAAAMAPPGVEAGVDSRQKSFRWSWTVPMRSGPWMVPPPTSQTAGGMP